MRFFLFIFLFIPALALEAQSLTGIWRGKRTQSAGGCFREYSLELHMSYANGLFKGKAYNYYNKDQFTKINFTGRYNPQTKRLVIIEGSAVLYSLPFDCVPCIKTYDLNWKQNGKEESLTGEWKGHEMDNSNPCPPGNIYLSRQDAAVFPVEIDQPDSLAGIQKQLTLQQREKEMVKNLLLDTSFISIDLYDNAEIDDDTVSVFLNNTLLLYKKRLTGKPLQLTIDVFPGVDYELMMYAENLGRIPPNTSLMIITAGNKKYEMRISSNREKNAVVRFRLDPVSNAQNKRVQPPPS